MDHSILKKHNYESSVTNKEEINNVIYKLDLKSSLMLPVLILL